MYCRLCILPARPAFQLDPCLISIPSNHAADRLEASWKQVAHMYEHLNRPGNPPSAHLQSCCCNTPLAQRFSQAFVLGVGWPIPTPPHLNEGPGPLGGNSPISILLPWALGFLLGFGKAMAIFQHPPTPAHFPGLEITLCFKVSLRCHFSSETSGEQGSCKNPSPL